MAERNMILLPNHNDLGREMATKAKVTRDRVLELLTYCPDTGDFRWKTRRASRRPKSMSAGWLDEGYIRITIDGRKYHASHLAWLIVHGHWPPNMVDHKDRDPANNRIGNLRLATNAQNQMNKKARTSGASGYKGVAIIRRRGRVQYRASIRYGGKTHVSGYFSDPKDAHAYYCAEAARVFGDFARSA